MGEHLTYFPRMRVTLGEEGGRRFFGGRGGLGGGLRGLGSGIVEVGKAWWSAIGMNLRPLVALYGEIWPWALVLLTVIAGLWWLGGALQGRIKDQALRVWRFPA